jgi:excinuclease ABC subunit C
MEATLSDNKFKDFGIDLLYPFQRTGLCCVEGQSPEQLRDQVRQYVPRVPGVYGMVDMLGRLIYVGKSKSLRNRLLSYFLPGNEEDKSGRIVQSTVSLVWETQPSEFAALIREQWLIRQFQPRFNVQGMPRRHQAVFVCLGRSPAEQFYVSRRTDPAALAMLGPLYGAARANRAVEVLNRYFGLRDCSSKQQCSFSEQLQLFDIELRPGCIRLEIGSCLGPCISACSRRQYDQAVQNGLKFLGGDDLSVVEALEDSMYQLALSRQFEQAVVVREDMRAVKWLSHRAADVAKARDRYTFLYSVKDTSSRSDRSVWYLIRRGIIEGAIAAPRDERQLNAIRQPLQKWWTEPDLVGSQFSPRPETLALVASWFRNQRSELAQTFILTKEGNLTTESFQKVGGRVCAS